MRSAFFIFIAAASVLAGARLAQADPAIFRTSLEDGFARIEMEWPAAVDYEASLENGVVVIRFARPFEADPSLLPEALPEHVAIARRDPSGEVLRLGLTREFRFHTSQSYNVIAFDIVEVDYDGEPPAVVSARERYEIARAAAQAREQEAQARQEAAEEARLAPIPLPLKVDFTETDAFSRVIFEWGEPPAYSVAQDGRRVEFEFDDLAWPRLARLRLAPPKFIEGVEHRIGEATTIIAFTLAEGAGARHFFEEGRIVVDFALGEGVKTGRFEPPAPEPATVARTPVARRMTEPLTVSTPAFERETAGPDAIAPVATPAAQSRSAAGFADPAPAPEIAPVPEQMQRGPVLRIEAESTPDGVRLRFPWGERAPAAVFRRGDWVWAVFDRAAVFDASDAARFGRSVLRRIEQSPAPEGASAIRFMLSRRTLVTAALDGDVWTLTFGDSIVTPTQPIAVSPQSDGDGPARMLIELENATSVHWIDDPDIGDRFAAVTAYGPPRGVIADQSFVEFIIRATSHGAMVLPIADDVIIENAPEGVIVTRRAGGATLSADNIRRRGLFQEQQLSTHGFINFAGWRLDELGSFVEVERRLHRLAAERRHAAEEAAVAVEAAEGGPQFAVEQAASQHRVSSNAYADSLFTLARFYMSRELGAEAGAVLKLIESENEALRNDPQFRALRGAALYMMRRFGEAAEEFGDGILRDDPHAALWRGSALLNAGEWARARRALADGERAVAQYPEHWRRRFGLDAAEASLRVNDLAAARAQLAQIDIPQDDKENYARKMFLGAEALRLIERERAAIEEYREVEALNVEPYGAWSAYWRAKLERAAGRITGVALRQRLGAMQYRWRGDALEKRIARDLGGLAVEAGDYRTALATYRKIVLAHPGDPVAIQAADDMATLFEELYLNGRAEELDPIPALALFYENIDLTPNGPKGDRMIRRLVDRLIDFDLLDQAAELLKHQTENRLRGEARARAATDLAVVYMMDRQPMRALETLRASRIARLPEKLAKDRRLLEARALAELGRHDQALELVELDMDRETDLLRADIYWDTEQWSLAAQTLESLLGDRWREEAALSDDERSQVMRAAIAYSLDRDQIALDRLRGKYAEKMTASPDADAFRLVTERIDTEGVRFRDLASRIAGIDTLDGFMSALRSRMRDDAPQAEDGPEPPPPASAVRDANAPAETAAADAPAAADGT